MDNVLHADFSVQLVHAVDPDDEDWKPACGEPDPSYVADRGSTLRDGLRWCGACQRAIGSK